MLLETLIENGCQNAAKNRYSITENYKSKGRSVEDNKCHGVFSIHQKWFRGSLVHTKSGWYSNACQSFRDISLKPKTFEHA